MNTEFYMLDHPSDLGIEARGRTLKEAFSAAASGLMSVILEMNTVKPVKEREIIINADDIEQLLVKWLSEILYLYDGASFVCKEFDIKRLESNFLCAVVRGEEFSDKKHITKLDVKAVTYHQLLVEEKTGSSLIRVYVDI